MTCTTTLVTLVSQERVAEPLPVCNDQSLVRVSPVKEVPKKKLPGMIHTTQENINKLFRVSGKRKASEFMDYAGRTPWPPRSRLKHQFLIGHLRMLMETW